MLLIGWLRGASRRHLRIGLIALAALNVGTIGYVLLYVPIVRLQPICVDRNAQSLFGPGAEVEGEMTYAFLNAYRDALRVDYTFTGRHLYVTFANWFDGKEINQASDDAARTVLARQTGVSESDIFNQRAGIPDFDEVVLARWPPCSGMRKLAIEGGEWAKRGPELRPEIARGRIVPLPHLTDPLLFEPVPRRRPENDEPPRG